MYSNYQQKQNIDNQICKSFYVYSNLIQPFNIFFRVGRLSKKEYKFIVSEQIKIFDFDSSFHKNRYFCSMGMLRLSNERNPVEEHMLQNNKQICGKFDGDNQIVSKYQQFIIKQIPILSMDIQQFISEPNQFTFQYDQSNCHRVPFQLYNQESQQQDSQVQNSPEDVLQMMTRKHNLIDKSLHQIITEAVNDYHLKTDKLNQFVRKVKKTKNILKRNRAKTRVSLNEKFTIIEKKQYISDESSTDKDTVTIQKQIKKQRNRISAQISRDRKKNYVTNLEQMNKQLAQQSLILKQENEKLRRQMAQKYVQNQKSRSKAPNNKFIRLLILLGVVFFIYLLKDFFTSKTSKSNNMFKMQKQGESSQKQLSASSVMGQNNEIVQQIRNQIDEIGMEDLEYQAETTGKPSLSFKETVIKKVIQIKKKTKQMFIPSKLAYKIIQAKGMLNF